MMDLLPCPHCGGKEHEIGNGEAGYTITCHSFACRASTGAWATETEARAAWNRRLSPSPTGGEAGAMGEIVSVEGSLGDMHVIKWANGHTPKVGDKLYAAPLMGEGEVEAVLEPFSDMAGEMFSRGWDASNVAIALDNPGDPHRVTAGDFFAVRALLTKLQEGGL